MTKKRKRKLWIQRAVRRPGALRAQLRAPKDETIPVELLLWAAKQPGALGRRARLAISLRRFSRRQAKRRGLRRYA